MKKKVAKHQEVPLVQDLMKRFGLWTMGETMCIESQLQEEEKKSLFFFHNEEIA
jgi:hypothetical protein